MAEYIPAYLKTLKAEGGNFSYSNKKEDPGGETVMGISRKKWPAWGGWALVDEAKNGKTFPYNLGYYTQLPQLVRMFYKQNFWDQMRLDSFNNQTVAEKLFDTAVNLGIVPTIKILQRVLNAANRRGKLWQDLVIDGKFGPATVTALVASEKAKRIDGVLAGLKALQGSYYVILMEKNEALEEFYLGWLTRAMA